MSENYKRYINKNKLYFYLWNGFIFVVVLNTIFSITYKCIPHAFSILKICQMFKKTPSTFYSLCYFLSQICTVVKEIFHDDFFKKYKIN